MITLSLSLSWDIPLLPSLSSILCGPAFLVLQPLAFTLKNQDLGHKAPGSWVCRVLLRLTNPGSLVLRPSFGLELNHWLYWASSLPTAVQETS